MVPHHMPLVERSMCPVVLGPAGLSVVLAQYALPVRPDSSLVWLRRVRAVEAQA
jgi:hypothetical protein